ncbi:galactokinase [Sanguibacter keddieii DSM 10542]|uniref:Galactokinase n=1 Tax=Sanguibacter keddieii (strain ATCC 51767 / DSM 10542 / NCFB 3025 / ST-74) TaxID=446469 RepID=D1BDW2_SANKS|nr:galactokinase [Sanguibacter keddieii]ACZ23183.1 galactokinase [Sanguibacter keddieii DSM 10542]
MTSIDVDWLDAWDVEDGSAQARALFTEVFDAAPEGVWSAPGRGNLIGEHTDYNGGLVLPFALPHRTYAAITRRTDRTVRLVSAQEAGTVVTVDLDTVAPGTVTGWAAYVVGVAWALEQAGATLGGFDVAITSCVPYGAGLSSSAALEGSVAIGLDALYGLGHGADDAGRQHLVAACIRAENEIAGAPTGGMDQAAALRSQEGHALLLDCRSLEVRQIPFDLASDGLALLVIDTRAPHALVDGQYAARRDTCEAAAAVLGVETLREVTDLDAALATLAAPGALDASGQDPEVTARRVKHVVSEIARVGEVVALLDSGRTSEVGAVLSAAHASLRDDYEVSCHELDVAVDAAVHAGALGGRMIGGGFGGSAIALVRVEDAEQVAGEIAAAFESEGLTAPGFLVAVAGGPAA